MKRRRDIVGGAILLALLFSAIAAQSVSASLGTTAFSCVKETGGPLWGEHCLGANPGNGEKQEFAHKAISETEQTHATLTNAQTASGTKASTPIFMGVVVGGVSLKLEAKTIQSTAGATLINKKDATTGEHYFEGEAKILISGVTVVEPANCKVTSTIGGKEVEGEVETEQIAMTTKEQGMNIRFTPKAGEIFATFNIVKSGAELCAAEQAALKLVGSFKGQPDTPGATVTFTHATMTGEKTLRFGSKFGAVLGIEGKITIKAGKEPATEPTNPISTTTVETPGIKGTTESTCKLKASEGGAGFSKEHCKPGDAVASGAKYEHASISESTNTETRISNATTGTENPELLRLKTTVGETAVEVTAASVSGKGTIENKKDPSGEHYVSGEGSLVLSGAKVTSPADKGCRVYTATSPTEMGEEEEIDSEQLTLTSTGQGDAWKLSPKEGAVLAKFWIAGCPAPYESLNKTWKVEGSVKGSPEGATLKFAEATVTSEGSLTIAEGIKAGLEGKLTISGRANSKEGYTPLSPTTVET